MGILPLDVGLSGETKMVAMSANADIVATLEEEPSGRPADL